MDPIGELNCANHSLNVALDRYIQACAALPNHYDTGSSNDKVLLDGALSELTKFSVHDNKIREAKAPLWRIRNQSSALVPISTLPSELMSHIFWLSLACSKLVKYTSYPSRRCPNVLQVCSRWRQITLATPMLWSHIDLDLSTNSPTWSKCFLKEAGMFAARSKEAPIELHMSIQFASITEGLTDFCKSIAPRLQSLDLETCDDLEPYFSRGQSWLVALVSGATPGTLTRLGWEGCDGKGSYLIGVDSMDMGRPHFRISVSEQQLEQFLCSVTALQLKNVYPFWTSRAYHGLVELILDCDYKPRIVIKHLELEGILKASPRLRTLHFGLEVIVEQGHTSYPPVELNELKSLSLASRHRASQEAVLNMVHLGQTPLELTIDATESTYSALASSRWVELYSFAARSKITVLRLQGVRIVNCWRTNFDPVRLLQHFPHLEVLVSNSFRFGQLSYAFSPELTIPFGFNPSLSGSRLRLLHLTTCVIMWTDFLRMLEMYPTEKVVLNQCQICARAPKNSDLDTVLRRLGPIVKLNKNKLV